tara:strand:- start:19888 stop:20010 length:123 start_codon:yes stop_codon:yes gene_type:complete
MNQEDKERDQALNRLFGDFVIVSFFGWMLFCFLSIQLGAA